MEEKRTDNIRLTPEVAIGAMRQAAADMRSMSEVIKRSGIKFPNADVALYLWQREADLVGSVAAAIESTLADAIRRGVCKSWREEMRDQQKASRARYDLRNGSIEAISYVQDEDESPDAGQLARV